MNSICASLVLIIDSSNENCQKLSMLFHCMSLLSPLGNGCGILLEQTSTQGCFLSSLIELGWVVLEKKDI